MELAAEPFDVAVPLFTPFHAIRKMLWQVYFDSKVRKKRSSKDEKYYYFEVGSMDFTSGLPPFFEPVLGYQRGALLT